MSGDVRGQLWPVYVVADVSGSMSPHIDDLNAGLGSIHRALLAQPMTAAKIRFTVIGFNNDAVVHTHLVDLRNEGGLTSLASDGGTNYGVVFDKLQQLIPEDVAMLKSQRYAVFRPVVFFLSDGESFDEWQAAHQRLTDRATTRAAPNIIACGIGEARAAVIRQVATRPQFAFVAIPGANIGKAIAEFCTALTKSIVASTRTLGEGVDNLIIEPPAGFTVALDEV